MRGGAGHTTGSRVKRKREANNDYEGDVDEEKDEEDELQSLWNMSQSSHNGSEFNSRGSSSSSSTEFDQQAAGAYAQDTMHRASSAASPTLGAAVAAAPPRTHPWYSTQSAEGHRFLQTKPLGHLRGYASNYSVMGAAAVLIHPNSVVRDMFFQGIMMTPERAKLQQKEWCEHIGPFNPGAGQGIQLCNMWAAEIYEQFYNHMVRSLSTRGIAGSIPANREGIEARIQQIIQLPHHTITAMYDAVMSAEDDHVRRNLAKELMDAGIITDQKNIDTFVKDLTEIGDNINTEIQRNEQLTEQEIISYSSAVACISIFLQSGFGDHPGKAVAALIALGFTNWRGNITQLLSNIIRHSGHAGPHKKDMAGRMHKLMIDMSQVAESVYNKKGSLLKQTIGKDKFTDIETGMGNVSNFAKIISSGFLYVAANVTGVVDTSSARGSGTPARSSMGALQAAIHRRDHFLGRQGAPRSEPYYMSDPNGGPLSRSAQAVSAAFHPLRKRRKKR